jgi:hypothetical protein
MSGIGIKRMKKLCLNKEVPDAGVITPQHFNILITPVGFV